MENKFKYLILIIFTLTFSNCTSVDYQTLKIDYGNKTIEVVSSEEYVIDSVSIERFDSIYFSKSLKNKSMGSKKVTLDEKDNDYEVYIDSLFILTCNDNNLNLDILIRKKGYSEQVTSKIIKKIKYSNNIQFLVVSYLPCDERVFTLKTDRPIY